MCDWVIFLGDNDNIDINGFLGNLYYSILPYIGDFLEKNPRYDNIKISDIILGVSDECIDSVKKMKALKNKIPYSQFKESLFKIIDDGKFSTGIFERDELSDNLMSELLGVGVYDSDIFSSSEIQFIINRDYSKLEKNYTCFCLTPKDYSGTLLFIYRKDPQAVLVNTTYFSKYDAKEIIKQFF